MVGENLRWGERFFPDIRISLPTAKRPVTLALPPVVQAAALLMIMAGAAALGVLGLGRIGANRMIADREAAVVRAENANADLKQDISGLRDKLAAADRDHRQAADRAAKAESETAALRSRLADEDAKLHALQAAAAAAPPPQPGGKEPPPAAELAKTLDQTRLALHQAGPKEQRSRRGSAKPKPIASRNKRSPKRRPSSFNR